MGNGSVLLLLKVTLVPAFVAAASLAARRWGPRVGGWLAGFPMVAGPVLVFYAVEQGSAFAAGAALHTLLGVVSLAAFALVYAAVAVHLPWYAALPLGWAVFGVGTWALNAVTLPLGPAWAVALVALGVAYLSVRVAPGTPNRGPAPAWDLPVRVVAAGTIVVTLTYLARWLGPQLSGLLTPFPVATSVLVGFTHSQHGGQAARRLLKGLLAALVGFTGFLVVLVLVLPVWTLGEGFTAAFATALAYQCVSLRWQRP
jgi:hypothetical protein